MYPDKGDTVASLAKQINMDADKYKLWLKAEEGTTLPGSAQTPLTDCDNFSVRNEVFIGVANMNPLANFATGKMPQQIGRELKGKGFESYD